MHRPPLGLESTLNRTPLNLYVDTYRIPVADGHLSVDK